MSDLGRVLRIDARRAALLVVIPALAAAGIAAGLVALSPRDASRDNAFVALAAAVRLLGPLAAAVAGWAAVRERRLDHLRGLGARSPGTGPLLDLLLLGGAAMVAYGIAAAAIAAEAGLLHPTGVLACAASLLLYVVLGYLAGRLGPAAAVAATAAGGAWAALRGPGGWWSLLPPATIGPIEPFTALRADVLADQVLCAAGLAAALLLGHLYAMTRRRRLLLPLAAALAVAAFGTAGLRAAGGPAVPAPATLTCRQWPLAMCVHPAMRSGLPALEAAMTPVAARLTGTPGAFTKVEQRPAAEPAAVRAGIARIHLPDLAPGYEVRTLREIRDALVGPGACDGRPQAASYAAVVDAWLLGDQPATGAVTGTLSAGAADPTAGNLFAGWEEQSRRDWLRAHFDLYRRCALALRHFR